MLREYIADFLAYCKVTGFSIKSIQSFHTNLKDFAVFVNELIERGVLNIRFQGGRVQRE